MTGSVAHHKCPYCAGPVVQWAKLSGPDVCPHCLRSFCPPRPETIPDWVWGVVVVLAAGLVLC